MNTKDRAAVIVVDYQNDFADKNGALYVNGGETLLDYINSIMRVAKNKRELVITSQDWHPKNHISFASSFDKNPFEIIDGEMKWPDHCVADTWGADFMQGFAKHLVTHKVFKWFEENIDSYSSFGGKEFIEGKARRKLDEILKANNVKILNIVGLATEYCDFYTVKDAIEKGYEVKLHTTWIKWVNVNPRDASDAIMKMKEMWAKIIT